MGDFTDRRGSDMTKEIELGEVQPEAAVKDCWQHQKPETMRTGLSPVGSRRCAALQTPCLWTSGLQIERIRFCCIKPRVCTQFVTASKGNE